MRGSPSATSTTLVRPDAPATRRTSPPRTPNAAATVASSASVALPSTARALNRTTSAPPCSPPTAGVPSPAGSGWTQVPKLASSRHVVIRPVVLGILT